MLYLIGQASELVCAKDGLKLLIVILLFFLL